MNYITEVRKSPISIKIPVPQKTQKLETSKESKTTETNLITEAAMITSLIGGGVVGRAAFQHLPNVEPLIALTVLSGFYLGSKKGLLIGSTSYYLSNFIIWGGQGPWTVFQVIGAGLAGAIGGITGKKLKGKTNYILSCLIGATAFQIVVNIGSLTYSSFTGLGILYLVSAIPFTLTHIASTIAFGLILYGTKEKIHRTFDK